MAFLRTVYSLTAVCLFAGTTLAAPTTQPVGGAAASAPASQPDDPTPLAKVGTEVVTRGQVRKVLQASGLPAERWEEVQPQVVSKLVAEALFNLYVKDSKAKVDDQAFEKDFQQQMDSAKSKGIDVNAELAKRGLTLDELKKDARQQFAFASAIDTKLKEENVSRVAKLCAPYSDGQSVQVRHVLIAASPVNDARKVTEAKAHIEKIKADIAAKKITFEDAARMYSDDPDSAERGGQIGEFSFEQLARYLPLAQAAFTAKLGEVTGPIQTAVGYHLLLVDNKTAPTTRPASQPTLEALAKAIINANSQTEVLMEMSGKYPVEIVGYTPAPFTKRKIEGPLPVPATQASQPAK